jgi:hypothetical protein
MRRPKMAISRVLVATAAGVAAAAAVAQEQVFAMRSVPVARQEQVVSAALVEALAVLEAPLAVLEAPLAVLAAARQEQVVSAALVLAQVAAALHSLTDHASRWV